jgi:SIR2-like domain
LDDDTDSQIDLRRIADAVERRHSLLFLGAGVHAPPPDGSRFEYPEDARPPLASALSEQLAHVSGLRHNHPSESATDLRRVALFFEEADGRGRLVREIRRMVQVGKRPSPVVRALAELDFPVVITTNYDRLFEDALVAAGKNPRLIIDTPEARRGKPSPLIEEPTPESPVVVKPHGDIEHPTTIVLTDEDYIHFTLRLHALSRYGSLPRYGADWTALIVGYSMLDYDFRLVYTAYVPDDSYGVGERYAVDVAPDALLAAVWKHRRRMHFIRQNIWDFVPELHRIVLGKEMPNYSG